MKRQEYLRKVTNSYFWRTYDKKEIDLVEERQEKLLGYEVKWKKERVKIPRDWTSGYPDAAFKVIHRDNYPKFIQ